MFFQELQGHSNIIYFVSFNQSSTMIASSSHDKSIIVWQQQLPANKQTQEGDFFFFKLQQFSPHDYIMINFCWNCIGESQFIVTGSEDMILKLWKFSEEKKLMVSNNSLKGHQTIIYAIDWMKQGQYIVSGGFKELIVWNRISHKNEKPVDTKSSEVLCYEMIHNI